MTPILDHGFLLLLDTDLHLQQAAKKESTMGGFLLLDTRNCIFGKRKRVHNFIEGEIRVGQS
jgi:hypothetical protein